MRKVLIIGIGAGNPDFLTVQAIDALNRADVVFIPDKGAEKQALKALRTAVLERFATGRRPRLAEFAVPGRDREAADYAGAVDDWREKLEAVHLREIAALGEGETGAFLVWGDPAIYDGTIGIVRSIRDGGLDLDIEVIPGISAVQALAAAFGLPLNRTGESILLTTGRRLADGMPPGIDNIVVLLDGGQAFARLTSDVDIYWGAYLGTPDELLVAGRLAEVRQAILDTRASARIRHGWVMDTYLLRARDRR